MRYMLMISADETQVDEVVNAEGIKAFNAWMDDLVERGVIRAHEGLQPSRTATTVRVRGDEVLLTDGPYIEAKEQIGGFYIIEAADLDAALEWASRTSDAVGKPIEVRRFAQGETG